MVKTPWSRRESREAYGIACRSSFLPIACLLVLSLYPRDNPRLEFFHTAPTLLIFSMVLLLVNFAWITELALVGRQPPRYFRFWSAGVSILFWIIVLLIPVHAFPFVDIHWDPQPIVFFTFVALTFAINAFGPFPWLGNKRKAQQTVAAHVTS